MSDREAKGPRRAWSSEEQETDAFDDTPADAGSRPRRGSSHEEPGPAGLGDEPEAAPTDPVNPFARPGSDAAATRLEAQANRPETPAERPDLASNRPEAATPIPAPALPRSTGSAFPSPAPRRSAMSSTSPIEAGADRPRSWFEAHRKRLAVWAAAGVALALVLALIAYFIAKGSAGTEPSPTPSATASVSPSATPTRAPATVADLVTSDDLSGIAPASEWAEVSTTEAVAEHKGVAFCLSTVQTSVNPTYSLQRSIATSQESKLAALHQIDVYADETAAASVLDARIQALSDCATQQRVAGRIVSSSNVTGLASKAFEINLVIDEATPDYHTLLLTQEGAALQLLDVRQLNDMVGAEALATALVRPQTDLNRAQDVTTPVVPVVQPGLVPRTDPEGWLTPSDLPRLRPGAGLWSASGIKPLDGNFGTGCENLALETVAGPTSREKVAFQLAQDDLAPALFGIDQAVFTFEDDASAAAFVTTLGTNIRGCKARLLGTLLSEVPGVASVGEGGVKGSSIIFAIQRQKPDKTKSDWQALITVSGKRVSYTLISLSGSYKFTDQQLKDLADRAAVRLTQAP